MYAGKLQKHSTGQKPLSGITKSAAGKRCGTFTVSSRNGEAVSGKTGEAGVRLCIRSPQVQKGRKKARLRALSSFMHSHRKHSTSSLKKPADVLFSFTCLNCPMERLFLTTRGMCTG